MIKKRLTALFFVAALVLAAPVTASAHDVVVVHPPVHVEDPPVHEDPPVQQAKCNAGRGNGSESTPATDCDPGNSGGKNNGGD
ncbi:MAG: hypothetical protein M3445_02505 [Actinomycetota bacterium]|nr:hypothetical protein [Actinomycetota bacterium]